MLQFYSGCSVQIQFFLKFLENIDIFPRNVNIYQRKGKKGIKLRNNIILPLKCQYFYEKSRLQTFEMSITLSCQHFLIKYRSRLRTNVRQYL